MLGGRPPDVLEDDIMSLGPRLTTELRTLRKEVSEAFGDISFMLRAEGRRTTSSSTQV